MITLDYVCDRVAQSASKARKVLRTPEITTHPGKYYAPAVKKSLVQTVLV